MSKITIKKIGNQAYLVQGGKKVWGAALVANKQLALKRANTRRKLLGRRQL